MIAREILERLVMQADEPERPGFWSRGRLGRDVIAEERRSGRRGPG